MKDSLTCADCGKAMVQQRTSLPQGQARCHPCRRERPASPAPRKGAPGYIAPSRLGTCASCGKPMHRSRTSLPQGMATCLDCRRAANPKVERAPFIPELRPCPTCSSTFTAKQSTHVYCSASCRPWSKRTKPVHLKTTPERGYGYSHQQERRRWAPVVETGQAECCLCGDPIKSGSKWHLDHNDDRTGYRGVAHAKCNMQDGRRRQALRLVADLYGFESVAELIHTMTGGHPESLRSSVA